VRMRGGGSDDPTGMLAPTAPRILGYFLGYFLTLYNSKERHIEAMRLRLRFDTSDLLPTPDHPFRSASSLDPKPPTRVRNAKVAGSIPVVSTSSR
jgi:hypothetical protein